MRRKKSAGDLQIHRSWRSVIPHFAAAFAITAAAYWLSAYLSIDRARFDIRLWDQDMTLNLPFFLIFLLVLCARPIFLMRDSRHDIAHNHLRSRSGIFSFRSVGVEVPLQDILGLRVIQSPFERFFNVGTIIAWTASADHPDVEMEGIGKPYEMAARLSDQIEKIRGSKFRRRKE